MTPKLEKWLICHPYEVSPYMAPEQLTQHLHGVVTGHSDFSDGDTITTAPISYRDGERVVTRSGTAYELGEIDPEYEAKYPNARERLMSTLPRAGEGGALP